MVKLADEILKESCAKYNIDFDKVKLVRDHHNYVYECEDKFLKIVGYLEKQFAKDEKIDDLKKTILESIILIERKI